MDGSRVKLKVERYIGKEKLEGELKAILKKTSNLEERSSISKELNVTVM